ncbi:hypothetical protein D3C84_839530 [compost metagenome]
MDRHAHTHLLRDGDHRAQEILQVFAQRGLVDVGVGTQQVTEVVQAVVFLGAGQARDQGVDQGFAAGRRQLFEVGLGLLDIFGAVFGLRSGALEDEQIEGGECGLIETQCPATIRQFIGQVGTGPVQHRHKVVADDIDAAARQVAHALLVVGDVLVAPSTAALDVFVHRNAFHHRPAQAGRFDHLLARRDGLH